MCNARYVETPPASDSYNVAHAIESAVVSRIFGRIGINPQNYRFIKIASSRVIRLLQSAELAQTRQITDKTHSNRRDPFLEAVFVDVSPADDDHDIAISFKRLVVFESRRNSDGSGRLGS